MPGTVANTNKVPVWVCYGTAAAEVNLGYCNSGDITVTVTPSWVDKKLYQTGDYLIDSYFKGATVTVSCELAETESVDTWLVAFGFGQSQVDAATPPASRFAFNTIDVVAAQFDIGVQATAIDGQLMLIPQVAYEQAATEHADNIVIPQAFVRNVGDILYSIDNNCALPVTFEGIFDPTSTTGGGVMFRGKKTATGAWVAA